jgi:hypothetical protein
MSDLLALAERVEKAAGPSFTLDALITIAIDPQRQTVVDQEPGRFPRKAIYGPITEFIPMAEENGKDAAQYLNAPAYTASLDAAITLAPEGWLLDQVGENWRTGAWIARVAERASPKLIEAFDAGRVIGRESEGGEAATPALALTAAALRARAASAPSLNAEIAGMGDPSSLVSSGER